MIDKIFTIGGYGHSRESFFELLLKNDVDLLVDIRLRRGMRGKQYAFLNSTALQVELSRYGISYVHLKELAPTKEVRENQKSSDILAGVLKKHRSELSDSFKKSYQESILKKADAGMVAAALAPHRHPCLFCVEGPAAACHRSLAADWFSSYTRSPITHLGRC